MDVIGIKAERLEAVDAIAADVDCLVGRVVEKLDLQFVLRVIERSDRVKQAVDHMHFIEDRKLDRDDREFFEKRLWLWMVARVLEVEENDRKAVRAEAGESDENENVRGVPDGRGPVHEGEKSSCGRWVPIGSKKLNINRLPAPVKQSGGGESSAGGRERPPHPRSRGRCRGVVMGDAPDYSRRFRAIMRK